MSSQLSQVFQDPTLKLYAGQEERTPYEWEEQYVDAWLLLEITEEDEAGEPARTKLIAITTDPMTDAFQQLWHSYADRNILTLFMHGKYSEPHPHVVAHAA
jgi:hypothetical protein